MKSLSKETLHQKIFKTLTLLVYEIEPGLIEKRFKLFEGTMIISNVTLSFL